MIPNALKNLRLYNECRKFIVVIYKLTKLLPDDERFRLMSKMRRAVVSILANIVEGYGRQTSKDQIHFYHMALGSFREVEYYVVVLLDLQYISKEQFLYTETIKDNVSGLLVNFIKSKKKLKLVLFPLCSFHFTHTLIFILHPAKIQ